MVAIAMVCIVAALIGIGVYRRKSEQVTPTDSHNIPTIYRGGARKYKSVLENAMAHSLRNSNLPCPPIFDKQETESMFLDETPRSMICFVAAAERLNNSDIPTDYLAGLVSRNTQVIMVVVRHGLGYANLVADGVHIPRGCTVVNLCRSFNELNIERGDFRVLQEALEEAYTRQLRFQTNSLA